MTLKHLILGLLSQSPRSGYDVNKAFQQSIQNFWTTDQSQIYRALHSLHEQGLVELEYVVQESLPDKKIYHLTESGRDELMRWLTTPITLNDAPTREGWLGQLYFGDRRTNAELAAMLDHYSSDLESQIAHLQTIRDAHFGDTNALPRDSRLALFTLEYGQYVMQAINTWMKNTKAEILAWDEHRDDNRTDA